MLRTVLVLLHAGAGVGGLIVGLRVLSPRSVTAERRQWLRRLYAALVAVLLVAMVALVALDWPHLAAGARVAFAGLCGLGAVIAYRLVRGHREARLQRHGWQARYLDHLYFTYISLWIGFLIVPALALPVPQVAVPATVLATLGIGHALLARYKPHVLPHTQAPPDPPGSPDGSLRSAPSEGGR
ncbi:hypothetical protein ER308_02080 [Egibacter rhizosphaerae]|uniref:DUF2306 domain-containing protein n=1 Tax=Egibacter rhizosphaerae TaxID=1670831 RepID=A0A411YB75_9ACTN|nr:hypothetical protein [Egibacter rhizosphaerae]QBI18471.1 hypothetical protein ER308_02080 [Egibacter rhizosphaerae]